MPRAAAALGYALVTVAVLWLALAGACTIPLLAGPNGAAGDFDSALGVLTFASPIGFGPPAVALLLGWGIVKDSRTPQAEPGRRPLVGSLQVAVGLALFLAGGALAIWTGEMLRESLGRDLAGFSDVTAILPLYFVMVGLVMVIGGARLVGKGVRNTGLFGG